MGLEPGLCFSTLVHVAKNGVKFQTLFKIIVFVVHFYRGQIGPKAVWNLTSAFPLWSMLEKVGSGSKPFLNHFGPFHFERGQAGPKWVWNLASAFPLWSMLEKVFQTLFKIILVLFILKGVTLVPKGFGT